MSEIKLAVSLPATSWQWLFGPAKEIIKAVRKDRGPTYLEQARLEVEQWSQAGARLSVTSTDRQVLLRTRAVASPLISMEVDASLTAAWYLPLSAVERLAPRTAKERRDALRTLVLVDDGEFRSWWVYNTIDVPNPDPDDPMTDYGALLMQGRSEGRDWPNVARFLEPGKVPPRGTTAMGLYGPTLELVHKLTKALGAHGCWFGELGSRAATGKPVQLIWTDKLGYAIDDWNHQDGTAMQGLSWSELNAVVMTLPFHGGEDLQRRLGLDSGPWRDAS